MAKKPKAINRSEPNEKYESVAIDSLRADPANVRTHSQRNIDAIKASLQRFGQQRPIVVNADGMVIAGNGTLQAAIELGWSEIEVVRTSLEGADAIAFAVADNRTSELAAWNDEALAEQLQQLSEIDPALMAATGFSLDEMNAMLGGERSADRADVAMPELQYRIIVLCKDEHDQSELFERLRAEGIECQLLMS
jgi:ParB-like chromosome segregation protein Spo0J